MANIPLQSITFPGLSDKYTTPTVDATLTQTGAAADAKKTGDEIGAIKNDLTKTEADLTGTEEKIDAVVKTNYIYSGNIMDATQASIKPNMWLTSNVVFYMDDGIYYPNPLAPSERTIAMGFIPKDANEITIGITLNGASQSNIWIEPTYYWKIIVDGLTVTARGSSNLERFTNDNPNLIKSYTLSTIPDHWVLTGKATSQSDSLEIGLTKDTYSDTYVPYVEPSYSYFPKDTFITDLISGGIGSGVAGYIVANETDDEPVENSNRLVKSGGVTSWAYKDSYNLVEPFWFDWENPRGGYVYLNDNLYLDAVPGEYLMCNCDKVIFYFYDASRAQISNSGTAVAYSPILVPENTVYMRMIINSSYIPEDHNVVVYYSQNAVSPRDDIRPYILHKNLIGMRGSDEIFDYYAPTDLSKETILMSQYASVRNINFCDNTVRVGTFNMYNPRVDRGWSTTKKMLKDFAVDIVGFQEVSSTNNRILTEYLKGWQMQYGATDSPVAIASHFEVLSHNTYTTQSTERKYMNCKIQLPRYGDKVNPVLSVYTYHGTSESQSLRLSEIAEILTVINQDTSDFIVIVGDTNSFDSQHPEWQAWENAGFTPAHNDGSMTTVISDGWCIDNIFFSSGITCKNVHVVPARDYMIQINSDTVPLSDHDFVFADLKFDFASLLS